MSSLPASLTLEATLERVASGDRAAFEQIYRLTATKLFGVCQRILSERQLAEDTMQDIYLTVWRRAGAFDPARGSAMTWLITLARNRALDRLRSVARRPSDPIELADDVATADPDPETHAIASDSAERLAACLATLDRADEGLLRRAFFEGATYADLAERTARPLGTIKSRIRRALARLKACLS